MKESAYFAVEPSRTSAKVDSSLNKNLLDAQESDKVSQDDEEPVQTSMEDPDEQRSKPATILEQKKFSLTFAE